MRFLSLCFTGPCRAGVCKQFPRPLQKPLICLCTAFQKGGVISPLTLPTQDLSVKHAILHYAWVSQIAGKKSTVYVKLLFATPADKANMEYNVHVVCARLACQTPPGWSKFGETGFFD